MRVVGVVLAAGESRRMGRLKALLPFAGHTVIEQVLQPLLQAELTEVVVVLGYRAKDITAVLAPLPVRLLYNPEYQRGMTTSVQVALRDVTPLPEAYLLSLVDQPLLRLELIQQLLTAFHNTHKGLVIPTYQGKRGHPLLLSASYRQEVLALGPQQGLNVVTRGHPEDTVELPVTDEAILHDMDYPEDYAATLRRWEQQAVDRRTRCKHTP
jgi:molybdenum cofactor cytidylyltransferase